MASFEEYFNHADSIVEHIATVIDDIDDPLLVSKYVGFISVAGITVYEQAIKAIFIDFAQKKHKVLGSFTESYFDRINGRIRYQIIRDEYTARFGEKYKKRFIKHVNAAQIDYMSSQRRDIKSAYNNLITWRNDFAHEGRINTMATFSDVVSAYEDGKQIIACLDKSMRY